MTTPFTDLETALVETIREIKHDLSLANENYLTFSILACGRVDGDIDITFELNKGYSSDGISAKGGRLAPVVDEYLRQIRWKAANKPLCLPNVENPESES